VGWQGRPAVLGSNHKGGMTDGCLKQRKQPFIGCDTPTGTASSALQAVSSGMGSWAQAVGGGSAKWQQPAERQQLTTHTTPSRQTAAA
jgi:hypothetical protein